MKGVAGWWRGLAATRAAKSQASLFAMIRASGYPRNATDTLNFRNWAIANGMVLPVTGSEPLDPGPFAFSVTTFKSRRPQPFVLSGGTPPYTIAGFPAAFVRPTIANFVATSSLPGDLQFDGLNKHDAGTYQIIIQDGVGNIGSIAVRILLEYSDPWIEQSVPAGAPVCWIYGVPAGATLVTADSEYEVATYGSEYFLRTKTGSRALGTKNVTVTCSGGATGTVDPLVIPVVVAADVVTWAQPADPLPPVTSSPASITSTKVLTNSNNTNPFNNKTGSGVALIAKTSAPAVFNGSIVANSLIIETLVSGALAIGQWIIGPGVAAGTKITAGSGTAWTVDIAQVIPSDTPMSAGTVPNVSTASALDPPGNYTFNWYDMTFTNCGIVYRNYDSTAPLRDFVMQRISSTNAQNNGTGTGFFLSNGRCENIFLRDLNYQSTAEQQTDTFIWGAISFTGKDPYFDYGGNITVSRVKLDGVKMVATAGYPNNDGASFEMFRTQRGPLAITDFNAINISESGLDIKCPAGTLIHPIRIEKANGSLKNWVVNDFGYAQVIQPTLYSAGNPPYFMRLMAIPDYNYVTALSSYRYLHLQMTVADTTIPMFRFENDKHCALLKKFTYPAGQTKTSVGNPAKADSSNAYRVSSGVPSTGFVILPDGTIMKTDGTAAAASVVLDPTAVALFARMSVQPTTAKKGKISDFIAGAKVDGFWSKLHYFRCHGLHDLQSALLNWTGDVAYDGTAFGTLTHTPGVGIAGDGATGYIETHYACPAANRYSAHIGIWSLSAGQFVNSAIGNATSRIRPRSTANIASGRINGVDQNVANVTDGTGHIVHSRPDAATHNDYLNGVLRASVVEDASVPDTATMVEFGRTNPTLAFWGGQMFCAHAGAALTATDVANMSARLTTLMAGLA